MSIVVGEHPIRMTLILVAGSTAHLVVPAKAGVLIEPQLEFAAGPADAAPAQTYPLALVSGGWMATLTASQVAALEGVHYARVTDGGRTIAAGRVQHNHGWEGDSSRAVTSSRIIYGGTTDLSGLVQTTDPRLSDARTPTAHNHDDRYYTGAEVDALISDISDYTALHGTGSPLGVVSAPPGTKYIDQNGTFGAWEWIKTSGTGTTGWDVSHGDTGWVGVTHLLSRLSPDNTGTLALRRLIDGTVRAWFSSLLLEPGNGLVTLANDTLPLWARSETRILLHVFRNNNADFAQQLVVSASSIYWYGERSLGTGAATRDRPTVGITGAVQWATGNPWPTALA